MGLVEAVSVGISEGEGCVVRTGDGKGNFAGARLGEEAQEDARTTIARTAHERRGLEGVEHNAIQGADQIVGEIDDAADNLRSAELGDQSQAFYGSDGVREGSDPLWNVLVVVLALEPLRRAWPPDARIGVIADLGEGLGGLANSSASFVRVWGASEGTREAADAVESGHDVDGLVGDTPQRGLH